MKIFAICFALPACLIMALYTLSHVALRSHEADAAAVSAVTGYLSGTNAVTLQDLVRCESVEPELVRRAMERINAAR